jgi:hypothetical protein
MSYEIAARRLQLYKMELAIGRIIVVHRRGMIKRSLCHRLNAVAIILVCGCYLLCAQAVAAPQEPVLGPDQWPATVEDTIRDIIVRMSAEDKERVRTTKKQDLILFHLGWGVGIRNHYGLWRGNERLILSACGRPCHPDDASMIIIEAVWQELQK